MSLRIASSARDENTLMLALDGELDLATSWRLEEAVHEAAETGAQRILIDMERLRYLDSAGLGALLRAKRYAAEHDLELWAIGVSTQPYARLLRSGLDSLLAQGGKW